MTIPDQELSHLSVATTTVNRQIAMMTSVMISTLVISFGTASSVPGRESVAQVQVNLYLGSVWSCQASQMMTLRCVFVEMKVLLMKAHQWN